jgi:hypothetical protein
LLCFAFDLVQRTGVGLWHDAILFHEIFEA